ncbi:hypothetical protein RO3G_06979 [Rhizopus delemar RA 99-880]|uniref:Uncharacterized protein n=1 Tax=Rhizopus delemar (strain RA 99-880 / ATCC MYA-4621 / FGSC 9543 / NRRL 43880) TaxID=246409 RepID=I1C1E4_RHIO9|nr:hypothetical protein RO3G_06979 [Rhizopus delemar RA 99-880]|eukprot:EIE82274.1 hypothetical protein RO3G_06979 [Rhizopus delemar RA 99-880]
MGSSPHSNLLSLCHPSLYLDLILWLSRFYSEISRCIRWRLDWLPGSHPKPCPKHPDSSLSKKHAIQYLGMLQMLQVPITIENPSPFLLNLLPTRKPRSFRSASPCFSHWSTICLILFELNHLHHQKIVSLTSSLSWKTTLGLIASELILAAMTRLSLLTRLFSYFFRP